MLTLIRTAYTAGQGPPHQPSEGSKAEGVESPPASTHISPKQSKDGGPAEPREGVHGGGRQGEWWSDICVCMYVCWDLVEMRALCVCGRFGLDVGGAGVCMTPLPRRGCVKGPARACSIDRPTDPMNPSADATIDRAEYPGPCIAPPTQHPRSQCPGPSSLATNNHHTPAPVLQRPTPCM